MKVYVQQGMERIGSRWKVVYSEKKGRGRRTAYIQKGREEEGEVGCKIKIEQDISISLFELCKNRNVGYYRSSKTPCSAWNAAYYHRFYGKQ